MLDYYCLILYVRRRVCISKHTNLGPSEAKVIRYPGPGITDLYAPPDLGTEN